MTATVLTPFTTARAVELGNRQWWKRLLPIGEIDYKGRRLHFTRDYLAGLKHAFDDKAYDQTAFQLADAANTHTNDPERFRGEIAEMDLRGDGLWVRLSPTDAGDQVLADNPMLGVSARIVEGYARADGKRYPAAIQHVLGTLDPRIPGLGPWQAIEAATPQADADSLIDLSGLTFAGEEASPSAASPVPASDSTPPEGTPGMPDLTSLTDTEKQRLTRLLALPDETLDALAAGGMVVTAEELEALTDPDGSEDGEGEGGEGEAGTDPLVAEIDALSDEELAALEAEWAAAEDGQPADDEPEHEPEGELVTTGLSAEAQFAIDLANAKAEETAREMAVVTARLRAQDYETEKRRFQDLGVPGLIVDMARPLLEGAGRTVELANGRSADAGQIVRQVLTEYAAQARLLDLDVELGSPMDEPAGVADDAAAEQRVSDRMSTVARFKTVTGL